MDPSGLSSLLDLINGLSLQVGEDKDVFGRVYEYCLREFALKEGKGKGEFYTPRTVVALLCELIEPYSGIVYEKTMPTLIQTNETYGSTQIDAFFESKFKIDAFSQNRRKCPWRTEEKASLHQRFWKQDAFLSDDIITARPSFSIRPLLHWRRSAFRPVPLPG